MARRPKPFHTVVVALFLLASISSSIAQQPPQPKSEVIRDRFAELAERISIAPAGRSQNPFTRHHQPALSWSNPERQTPAGAMFLWTASGRPQVALCLYPDGEQVIDLEFQSLSEQALTADSDNQLLWQPAEPGVRWQPIEKAPRPARSAFLRLRQMRVLAREFSSKLVPPNKNPIELRLLDTPVYRYELDQPTGGKLGRADDELIDGAVFTFVQGTDPEVLLLVEAHQDGDRQAWRYALARMSMVPTQVRHGETTIWETDWAIQRPHTPYYVYKSF
ncbi:hypothetical protein Enr13x_76900 [Stieleria neptunia]|uniref:Uncharacterized protein n=1 Tax=Stieleria neptunia TaxID=2527979 RepID=A0A518I408_9BACT|nr:hypothetical protein [Stieleria neptunia]QDV47778.1 hypothetical protein Enr13x_76900 [Stieleria neptunia]